jgi:energy-coupling factor transporter ATP-binding protein EcfA2
MIYAPYALNMREVALEAIQELARPYPATTLPDWPMWNDMTGGFRAREFSILCGSTGAGKTTLLANISAQLLKAGTKHFVMSVETGHTDFMKRILSVLEGTDLNTGEPVPINELARITSRHEKILASGLIEFSLYDNRIPVAQLVADLRYMAEVKGCKVAFIDNLNFFMEVTRSADTILEMDRVVHELIIFCKQVDMHIVMVMHPKKVEGGGRITHEDHIKGSSTANQEAHNIFLFNRPDPQQVDSGIASPWQREITIRKMRRRGQFVGKTLIFDSVGTRYTEKGYL